MYDNCEINTFILMGLYYSELKYIYSIGLYLKKHNIRPVIYGCWNVTHTWKSLA
jgi:hypothetical protein